MLRSNSSRGTHSNPLWPLIAVLSFAIFICASTAKADFEAECLIAPESESGYKSIDRIRGVRILSKDAGNGHGLDLVVVFRGDYKIHFKDVLFGYDGLDGLVGLDPVGSITNDFPSKFLSEYLSKRAKVAMVSCKYTEGDLTQESPAAERRFACAIRSMQRSLRRVAVIRVNMDAKAARYESNPLALYLFSLDGRFIGSFGPTREKPPCTAGTLICDPG